jgi:predicted nucleotidyltransferase
MQKSGLDSEGFIISEVSTDSILPEYKSVIDDSIMQVKNALPGLIHSVYVYGSVARGNAIKGKSDLELLVIFMRQLSDEERNTLNHTLEQLSTAYRALVREVGVADCTIEEMLDPAHKYGWGAYLKILCVCVDGEDITQQFGRFKVTPDIAMGFNGDVGKSIEMAIQKLQHTESGEYIGKIASTLARKLIRSSYGMAMTRAQVWTTQLNEQAQVFVQYFPEKQGFVAMLQSWITNPPHDKEVVVKVLESDGKWLMENFEKESLKLTI